MERDPLMGAGDWIQIDDDLPQKPEFLRLLTTTGVDVDTLIGRLVRLWTYVDRHTTVALIRNLSAVSLAHVAGGDENFWRACEGEWLRITKEGIEIQGYKKRFSKSAKRRALDAKRKSAVRPQSVRTKADKRPHGPGTTEENRTEENRRVETVVNGQSTDRVNRIGGTADDADHKKIHIEQRHLDEATPFVADLFKRCGYSGRDGALLWKAGVLAKCALGDGLGIAESWASSAAEGTRINAKKNPLGHFRTVLRETCTNSGKDLDAMLKLVILPRGFIAGPPRMDHDPTMPRAEFKKV